MRRGSWFSWLTSGAGLALVLEACSSSSRTFSDGAGAGGAAGTVGADKGGTSSAGNSGASPEAGVGALGGSAGGAGGAPESCVGKRTCSDNHCAPLAGCCADNECANGFACVAGACSTTQCQPGLGNPCKGKCIAGCCTAADCPEGANGVQSCSATHSCELACKTDFADCDDKLGCEVDLRVGQPSGAKVSHCGACGGACDFTNGGDNASCATHSNSCVNGECWARFNYIGDAVNGYQCQNDRPHATITRGDCDVGCAYQCALGWNDCDADASNGCETTNAAATAAGCTKQPFWSGSP